VDKNFVGFSESSSAVSAPFRPRLREVSSLNLRDDTNDISDIAKMPLSTISAMMISISKVDTLNIEAAKITQILKNPAPELSSGAGFNFS
jgi:hypothetical protein